MRLNSTERHFLKLFETFWLLCKFSEIVLDFWAYIRAMGYTWFKSKAELAREYRISRETLRLKLKEIKELNTGRRQLLYPWEQEIIHRKFREGTE